jgi:hypothetical protein
VVHYYDRGMNGEDPCAAVVAAINKDGTVNLTVFDQYGHSHAKTNVVLVQQGEPFDATQPRCQWMDYQLGQAAKTEQAETVAEAARRGFYGESEAQGTPAKSRRK